MAISPRDRFSKTQDGSTQAEVHEYRHIAHSLATQRQLGSRIVAWANVGRNEID
jgi:hypothetical protein